MKGEQEEHDNIKAKVTLKGAIVTIVIADAIMSIDNALALAQIASEATDI